ncbi:MAG: GntR family transcriptional regulator [Burkholderiales bacterium]|nr:GntR family transcriptional regulator [Burkholderiales bacterium]
MDKSIVPPVAREISGSPTLATAVYRRLRTDIVKGQLQPGEKLRIEALSERYAVGASPLREALNRLSTEGLVAQKDQRGFVVAPISQEELTELTRTRCWIGEIALRESIRHGDAIWEESVLIAYHRLRRQPKRSADNLNHESREWDSLHQAFHTALIAACPSRLLIDYMNQLFDRSDRYRNLVVARSIASRDIDDEHQQLMDAVIGRDTERAVRLHSDHLNRTAALLLELLQNLERTEQGAA